MGLLCFLAGLLLVPVAIAAYLAFGHPPVAVTDPAFPFEKAIVSVPLGARIDKERPHDAGLPSTPQNLHAGAALYQEHCAFCHGLPNHPSEYARHMYPPAPQLWQAHRPGVVGVSDDPVGETYWKIKNGIRLSAMPAYANLLSEPQMWQLSVLLADAANPQSPELQKDLAPPAH